MAVMMMIPLPKIRVATRYNRVAVFGEIETGWIGCLEMAVRPYGITNRLSM